MMASNGLERAIFVGALGVGLAIYLTWPWGATNAMQYVTDVIFASHKLLEKTCGVKKGRQSLRFQVQNDDDDEYIYLDKPYEIRLTTPNATKIRIKSIVLGRKRVPLNNVWIDNSHPYTNVTELGTTTGTAEGYMVPFIELLIIRVVVQCDENTSIHLTFGRMKN
eukprot:1016443_1